MDFRLDDDQIALRDAVRGLSARHFALDAVAAREGAPATDAAWRDLAAMGIFELLVPDGDSVSASETVTTAVALEELSAHLATGPVLWTTITAPLLTGGEIEADRVAGVLVVGDADGPVVIEHATEADVVIIVQDDRVERVHRAILPKVIASESSDPLTPTVAYAFLPSGDVIGGPDEARALRLAGTALAAAQLVGVAQGALDVAAAYALERHQFGVPIGSFQAIKHLLSDMYVRVELARSSTYAAAAILDDERGGDAEHATSAAKLLAGQAGIDNGRSAVQILGGMGFTWEMLPHYFLRRAWVLGQSFGTAESHALALGSALDLASVET
ncbi:MAG: acyl-CoA dehydrogenase [Acidimicrobiia bacterium]